MRCPACGARNSEDATFCTQCYADVRPRPVPEPSAGASATSAAPPAARQPPAEPVDRDVRDRDGVVEWRCAACDGWTELAFPTCAVCGSPRRGFGDDASAASTSVSAAGIVGASLIVPGLGHMLAGRYGTGLARAILALLWVVGGVVLVAGGSGIGTLPGWLLLLSGLVIWGITVLDAKRVAEGDDEQLLTSRGLGALVLGVTLALVVSAGVVMMASA